jgi:hypothetical protein
LVVEIGVEEPASIFSGNSYTLILHGDPNVISGLQRQSGIGGDFYLLRSNLNDSPIRHGLIRVQNQVVDDMADLSGIHFAEPEPLLEVEFGAGLGAPQSEGSRFLQDLRQGGGLPDGSAPLGKGQKLLG